MKRLFLTLAFLALAASAFAQGNHIYTSGTTPTSCRIGDIFIKTASGNNPRQFLCTASNIWSPVNVSETYVTKTGNYTLTAVDGTVELITNIGTFTLPTAVGIQGRIYGMKNLQTANALTLATASSQTIDGASPGTISNGCLYVMSDGANWRVVGSCGFPLTSLTSGGVIYASSAVSIASSAALAANAIVIGGGAGSPPATTTTGTGVVTALGVNTGSVGAFVVNSGALGTPTTGNLALNATQLFDAGVCQNVTASLGASTPTSNAPTAACKTGSNTTFGVAQFTATTQSMQGHIAILEAVSSTTIAIKGMYFGETTSTGSVVWTFSYARVAAGSTLDPAWTDVDITDSAGTANQLNLFSGTATVGSLAVGDLLFWKITYKTAPTTPGNQDLINLAILPVLLKPIGG